MCSRTAALTVANGSALGFNEQMVKRILIQLGSIAVWFSLVQGCLALKNVPMGTLQMCREGV